MKKITDQQSFEEVVSIPSTKINIEKIVDSIRTDIKKKKIQYIQTLSEHTPDILDVYTNSEFLLEGWHEPESLAGTRARWTEPECSFLFNIRDSLVLKVNIIHALVDLAKKPLLIELHIENKKVAQQQLTEVPSVLSFEVPKQYHHKTLPYTLIFKQFYKPAEEGMNIDMRKLGVVIKTISNLDISEVGERYLPTMNDIEYNIKFNEDRLKVHSNPENLFPDQTKFKFVKKMILRIMRLYTTVQVAFNRYVVEHLSQLQLYTHNLAEYTKNLDAHFTQRITLLQSQVNEQLSHTRNKYYSKYFHEHEDEFYVFQQNKFRGSDEDVKKKQQVYIEHLLPIRGISGAYPFIEAGFGRGEFLEILKESGIQKIIGVDTNSKYIESAHEKGFDVVHADIMKFMEEYEGKISGFSAFHLFEHLEFEQIFDLVYLIDKKMEKGGLVLIETPNPANLQVGSTSFYYDHTHKTKLPPQFLKSIFEYFKFSNIGFIYSSPQKEKLTSDVEELLFGHQDYAIVANK